MLIRKENLKIIISESNLLLKYSSIFFTPFHVFCERPIQIAAISNDPDSPSMVSDASAEFKIESTAYSIPISSVNQQRSLSYSTSAVGNVRFEVAPPTVIQKDLSKERWRTKEKELSCLRLYEWF
jgi:hypothetical protein